jgi:hypothetical protein
MRISVTPILLLLPLVACDQQTVTPSTDVGAALARVAPDPNKNQVIRFQDHLANSWTGEGTTLRATHTTFPIPDFNDKPERNCGPQQDLAKIDFKQVGVVDPVDFFASELHIQGNGPVWIIVRDLSQPGDCYGVTLVAEGPGTIRYLDNDAFGVSPGEHQANSWGFVASGTLTTPDGQTLTYQGNSHYVVNTRNGELTFSAVVERVTLH